MFLKTPPNNNQYQIVNTNKFYLLSTKYYE